MLPGQHGQGGQAKDLQVGEALARARAHLPAAMLAAVHAWYKAQKKQLGKLAAAGQSGQAKDWFGKARVSAAALFVLAPTVTAVLQIW